MNYHYKGNNPKQLTKATVGAAAYDIYPNLPFGETITIAPMERVLVPTGLFMAVPEGYKFSIFSRSGNAYKKGVIVLNAPGTIDSDYRGEVGVILHNTGNEPVSITNDAAIAQGHLERVALIPFIKVNSVEELSATDRGSGGFGSTGIL